MSFYFQSVHLLGSNYPQIGFTNASVQNKRKSSYRMVITYAEKCILKIHFSVTIQFLFFKFSLYLDIKLQSEHIQSI